MIRELQKKLKRLERYQPPPLPPEQDREEEYANKYLWEIYFFAVAHYLSDADPHESPMAAYIRALGYTTTREHEQAITNDPAYNEKLSFCKRTLFAKFSRVAF